MGAARMSGRRTAQVAALLVSLAAAGCAHAPFSPGAPRGASGDAARPSAAPPSSFPAAGPFQPCRSRTCAGGDPKRRQYFDERRRRYYFFDPVRKRYYWEDGTPRA